MRDISVIICTYNRADVLQETLTSLAVPIAGYHGAAEVLIVNNNSTDDTDRVVTAFMREHPTLAVKLLHEQQAGLSYARNCAIAHAAGDVLCFLDDDVLVPAHWLTELLRAFTLGDNIGCVAGRITLAWPAMAKPAWIDEKYDGFYSRFERGDTSVVLPPGEIFYGANFAITRHVVEAVGTFNTTLGRKGAVLLSGEDADYAKRIQQHGFAIAYSATGSVAHQVAPERLSVRWLWLRYFWQGVTTYFAPEHNYPAYPLFMLPKLLSNLLVLPFVGLLLNKRLFLRTWFRIANALGPFYGWYLQLRHRDV